MVSGWRALPVDAGSPGLIFRAPSCQAITPVSLGERSRASAFLPRVKSSEVARLEGESVIGLDELPEHVGDQHDHVLDGATARIAGARPWRAGVGLGPLGKRRRLRTTDGPSPGSLEPWELRLLLGETRCRGDSSSGGGAAATTVAAAAGKDEVTVGGCEGEGAACSAPCSMPGSMGREAGRRGRRRLWR